MTDKPRLEVRATNLGKELVRVEFRHSNIVSDHPVKQSGSGKGPSPGVLLMSALVSSAVLRVRQAATAHGIPLRSAVARGLPRYDRERIEGPLAARIFMGEAWRQIELAGEIGPEALAILQGAVETCPISAAVRDGVEVDEQVSHTHVDHQRLLAPAHNSFERMGLDRIAALGVGDREPGATEAAWRVSAGEIGDGLALVDTGETLLSASTSADSRRGPSPTELMLGALAACTAIYVSRFAGFHGIPLERVNVLVSAEDADGPIRRIVKTAEIVGNLTPDEVATCKAFANVCAIGETLQQGARLNDVFVVAQAAAGVDGALSALSRPSPPPAPEAACDDGLCCIPEFGAAETQVGILESSAARDGRGG